MTFKLHPQLANDTALVNSLKLCDVLLMNDEQYPWLILVPKIAGVSEIFELSATDQKQLWEEVTMCSQLLKINLSAKKMNVATLGNVVPQLHIHVIARFEHDPSWPAPVWGKHPVKNYSQDDLQKMIQKFKEWIPTHPGV